jgi:hypothetical protein
MKKQTKTLLTVGGILAIPVVIVLSFILGLGIGLADNEVRVEEVEVPKEVIKEVPVVEEVEKIVYKDSPETLELLDLYEKSMETTTEAYITIFEVAEACASYHGQPVHQDYYTVYEFAKEYYNGGF